MTLLGVRECTLFSSDARTNQLVAAAGAALGLRISCQKVLPGSYPVGDLLLIATDLMPTSIPTRPGVLLLDREVAAAESSGALVGLAGADREVITNLVGRISNYLGEPPVAHLLSISSAVGGLGLTTLIALFGLASTRSNQRTLIIDQQDGLSRILGANAVLVDHQLQPLKPPKVGVLSSKVPVTPALLVDARSKFDFIITSGDGVPLEPDKRTHYLLLSANTALAVERSADQLGPTNSRMTRILLRQMSYGSLSVQQVGAALHQRHLLDWPEDRNLAMAADLGDIGKAKSAMERVRRIWVEIVGRSDE